MKKLGFSLLQLVTVKAITLPGLTTGNMDTESMTDAEAMQKTIERIQKTVSMFREADMRKKLRDCQDNGVRSYQH